MPQPLVDVDPRDRAFYQNPYDYYAQWHSAHPRFRWAAYDRRCFAAFADVDRILRDRRFGRALPEGVGTPVAHPEHLADFHAVEQFSLLNLEPPAHSTLRKLVNRAFVSSKVAQLHEPIVQIADRLIDDMVERCEVDLLRDYFMPLPAIVIARLLGVPQEHVPQLLDWSHAMVKVYTGTQTYAEDCAANTAARAFSDLIEDLIKMKRRTPAEDLLSHLVHIKVDGLQLCDAQIVSTAVLLLNAGHEATVHQSGNAVKTILQHNLPVREHFDSLKNTQKFVEEIMRFDAPLHLFMRYAMEDVDLGEGLRIEAGEEVALLLGAANRDPQRFVRANAFWPERPDPGHVSFGAGLHFCLGAPLARLEMQLSISRLFERLPAMRLTSPPEYADSFHFHGLVSLGVEFY